MLVYIITLIKQSFLIDNQFIELYIMTNKDKRQIAEQLYLFGDSTQKEIASDIGVSAKTMSQSYNPEIRLSLFFHHHVQGAFHSHSQKAPVQQIKSIVPVKIADYW